MTTTTGDTRSTGNVRQVEYWFSHLRRDRVGRIGGGGRLPPPRRAVLPDTRRPHRSGGTTRHGRHHRLPHGCARRPCRTVRRLRRNPDRLQLLPQPALPEVSRSGARAVARRAARRGSPDPLFPRRLHATARGGPDRLPEQGRGLRHPVPFRRCGIDEARRQSAPSRSRTRHPRRPPYLGADTPASSPHPLRHTWRRTLARWTALGVLQAWVLPARPSLGTSLPRHVPRRT